MDLEAGDADHGGDLLSPLLYWAQSAYSHAAEFTEAQVPYLRAKSRCSCDARAGMVRNKPAPKPVVLRAVTRINHDYEKSFPIVPPSI